MLSQRLPHFNRPIMKLTIAGGSKVESWFDIVSLDPNEEREDEVGLKRSVTDLMELIKKEKEQFSGRLFIGAVSLYALAHQADLKVDGVIALSGFLPMRKKLTAVANSDTPLFMGHGTHDPVVPFQWGRESHSILASKGLKYSTFKDYPGLPHSCDDRELEDLVQFIQSKIN
ncbi:alpha/beta-hydrolase [Rozella allomycis CSF55]|uniref:Acyl-protein thioesterase 1 n=1 Tax=Rozella allomycis (strain CSF55) TaxID=988480 RepID=A0A4P9YIZ8_ROZAC|nr:alpha/beta-hydrolase [Rozella allomycis CSF55]